MPNYIFKARDRNGNPQQGQLEAVSPSALAGELRTRGWLVLEINNAGAKNKPFSERLARLHPKNWLPARSIDVELGFQQLALMLRNGMTLLTALRTVAEQTNRAAMRKIWFQVADDIQEGSSFGEALSKHNRFSHITVQLVKVGEQTGILDTVILRAAELMEHRRNLRGNLLTALAYPTLVFVAAIGVSVFLVFYVIPKLANFLSSLGRRLPAMTQSLVDVSSWMVENLLMVVISLVAVVIGLIVTYLWPPGRLFIDRISLRIPILGGVFRMSATALFARGLGLLVRSGVTLLEGLRTLEEIHRNRHLVNHVAAARQSVMRGGDLGSALKPRGTYLPMLSHMVVVGESAGNLDDVLDEVARFYDHQLEKTIQRLSALIEPVIIIVVGAIVGYVYIAFFMALFAVAGGS